MKPHSSRGISKEGVHGLPRRPPSETFSGALIQELVNAFEVGFSKTNERGGLGMQPTDKAVGILVGSTFPRMVRVGEEDIHARLRRHPLMAGKLFSVVKRQAQPGCLRHLAKQPAYRSGDFPRFLRCGAIKQRESRASFDQRHQVSRLVCTLDQVAFPVPHRSARLDLRRPRVNHALVRDLPTSPAIFTGTTTAAFAMCARQVPPEISAGLCVGIDVLVEGLFADPGTPLKPGASTDHIRRPSLTQTGFGVILDLLSEPTRPWSLGPLLSHPMRLLRPIAAPSGVLRYLSADRARRAVQPLGDLSLSVPGLTPHTDQPTFCNGHASVSHYVLHVLLAHEERNLPRDHLHITSVALAARARAGLSVGAQRWHNCLITRN